MSERPHDRWVSVVLSVLVHGTIVGLLVWGVWNYKTTPPPPQQLAIEGVVVSANTLPKNLDKAPAPPTPAPVVEQPPPVKEVPPEPEPPPPQPEPEPAPPEPPRPSQEELDRAAAQQRQEEDKRVQEAQAREQKVKEQEARELALKQERDKRAEAERKAKAEADRKAREKAEEESRQRAAEQRIREQRESELRSQLAAEERAMAARSSAASTQYVALIAARIERAWIRPPTARAGLACEVFVTQIPGGQVTGVRVGTCNGDEAVRQSIEAAAYRASPLPIPDDPALFDRNLVVTFRPQD